MPHEDFVAISKTLVGGDAHPNERWAVTESKRIIVFGNLEGAVKRGIIMGGKEKERIY